MPLPKDLKMSIYKDVTKVNFTPVDIFEMPDCLIRIIHRCKFPCRFIKCRPPLGLCFVRQQRKESQRSHSDH